jgi:selenide,water dikinase
MSGNFSILSNCTSGGCGAKIGPGELSTLLSAMPKFDAPKLIVGFDSSDDAAVYEIGGERAIVSTVDFFSPMVDDARTFGRIAAANAMSDIWAMGGSMLFALNLLCFPEAMEKSIAGEILAGGAEKIAEAGAVVAGGHSIYDHEPKYGLAATGVVETKRLRRNDTPVIGHKVILTKPLGVGIVMAALRGNMASSEAARAAVASMERLNRYAAECAASFEVSACTDVTGFGLLVHALEMVSDKTGMTIYPENLPAIPEAISYANEFLLTAAGQRNRNYVGDKIDVSLLPFATQELMFDPQTSGGLLIAAAPDEADALLRAVKIGDPLAEIIGEITHRSEKPINFK